MRQSLNNLKIVGKLKSKKVVEGTTKKGDPFISLDLVVESKIDDLIMNNKVSFWAKRTSKLAAGYLTVANEYKTIDDDGEELAERISISGNYEMNEYMSNGEYKSFNKIKGTFINRIKEGDKNPDGSEIVDAVELMLECVVVNQQPELTNEGTLTGGLVTKLYSVGYNDTINEFNNILVEKSIAEQFKRMFPNGTTAVFYIKINNYVVVKEEEIKVEKPMGFGQSLSNISENQVAKDYINETIIIGGKEPIVDGKYTQEEIAQMSKIRELAVQELTSVASQPPAFGTGFGGMTSPDLSDAPF